MSDLVEKAQTPPAYDVRVALTGASGFCGGAALRALQRAGSTPVVLGRREMPGTDVPFRHFDLDDPTSVPDLRGSDVLLHYAAAVGDPPRTRRARDQFVRANVESGAGLLAEAQRRGVKVVWISSASVYDTRISRNFIAEDHPTSGGHLNLYAETKAAGDALALAAGAVVLRPRAVYGPGDPHLLPRLRRLAVGRGVRRVAILPGPDVQLSITSVATLTEAALQASAWAPGAYNVADSAPIQRDALITALFAALGEPVRVRHVPLPPVRALATATGALARFTGGDPAISTYGLDQISHNVVLDCSRALSTGWRAPYEFSDYLAELRSKQREDSAHQEVADLS